MYKYYYGICEHCLCVQVQDHGEATGYIDADGFLRLKTRNDDRARLLFSEAEARKANACKDEAKAVKYRRRILSILKNPVREVTYGA